MMKIMNKIRNIKRYKHDPNDYSITFRTRRTKGRSGGGCQLSFTGDGKPQHHEIDLKDNGESIKCFDSGRIRCEYNENPTTPVLS